MLFRSESIRFERVGGGDEIEFYLYPTENSDKIEVMVYRYHGQVSTNQFFIDKSIDNSSVFSSFHDAINSRAQINGSFKQTSVPTGTWLFIYVISNSKETEITNTELRNSLLKFERIVKDHFQEEVAN